MNLKRIVFLSICMIVSIGTYSQSKLINAGKAGKVSGTVKTETNKPKSNTSPKPKAVVKQSDDKYKSVGYMEISGISFANGDDAGNLFDDYGSDLYAGDIKYLMPKIFYKGLASSQKEIILYYKIIKEDGSLMTGKNSPEGFTYSSKVKVEPGLGKSLFLTGYGNNYATAYTSGQYKYEIWYNGNMLFQKGVRIHNGKTPVVNSKLMKINKVLFGNTDKNSNLITDYGVALTENKVKYLQPQISYEGYVQREETVTLMIRIVFPDGNMSKGNKSPICFTTQSNFVIKSGNNITSILGWGSEDTTVYKLGEYIYEIWLNGDKIYETTFEVKKESETVSPILSDHEYVDLGLSVLWATCNVGAKNSHECGGYFSWGEIEAKLDFSSENYKYDKSDVRNIGENISGTSYDAATMQWGNNWRIPTLKEMKELIDECKWEKETVHGQEGYKIIGKNGNSIFLPATGFYLSPKYGLIGHSACKYWTATLSDKYDFNAYCLSWNEIDDPARYYGLCIRPVCNKR